MNIKNKTILVTGATGSFGKSFIESILNSKISPKKIIIFSRDELKQFNMQKKYSNHKKKSLLRFFIGDVRDRSRLKRAFVGVDIIIHAAALKQVPAAEYNPIEFINTNIVGAQNIVEEAIDARVKKIIALSTDKACSPINLYGATKLCSDKLFISANNYVGKQNTLFSVVRYGNVFGSRGSVYPYFKSLIEQKKPIYITDIKMTRFNISLKQSVEMVHWTIKKSKGGEIVVPKIPSIKILDLANIMTSKKNIKFSQIRPGEKLNEELISSSDARYTFDLGKYYIIDNKEILNKYKNCKRVNKNFSYNSANNIFMSQSQLKKLIADH